jgi:AcrR family transcriptional regulator
MAHASGTASSRSAPVTERGRVMRAAIIDSAARLMTEQGVAATSLDEVLASAGCGKGQMYHYFDGKSDLVRAVIGRQIERILEAQQDALDHVNSWDGLDAWAEHILRMHSRRGGPFACPLGTMAAELKNSKAFRPALDAAFGRWEAPLRDGLQDMKDRGELIDEADPARLASMVIAALQGGMLLARVRRDVTVLRDSLDGALSELRRWSTA